MKLFRSLLATALIVMLTLSPVLAGNHYGNKSNPQSRIDLNFSTGTSDSKGGLGDATTAYTGTNVTYIDEDGVMQTLAINTTPLEAAGVPLWGAAANILLQSRNFDEAIWETGTPDAAATANETGIDGVINAAYTIIDSNGGFERREQSLSISTTAETFCQSFYILKDDNEARFPEFQLKTSNGASPTQEAIQLNTKTGALDQRVGSGAYGVESVGIWWRLWVVTSNIDGDALTVQIFPAMTTTFGTIETGATGSIIVDAAQLKIGAFPTSYIDNDGVDEGAELVTDGTFDVVTDDAGEMATGLLTIGNCYLISLRTDGDFISAGSPDNVAGTYFNATTTGVGLLDAGDKVFPVTFDNWIEGTGWAPQATAGSLTGKAQKIAGTASYLLQNIGGVEDKVYRTSLTLVRDTGYFFVYTGDGGTYKRVSSSGSPYVYQIWKDNVHAGFLGFYGDASFAGTVDDVSVVEHGTVRTTMAGATTFTMDAATKALLAGKGAMVCKVTPGYSRASTATNTLYPVLWVADSETYSLLSLYNIADSIYWSTYDGSSACYVATPIECGETDTVIIRWGFLDGAQEKYQIGFLHGTTWTWRDAVNFDGSYVIGNDLIVGYGNEYPFHIQGIKFYSDPYTRTFFESRY